jgi:lipid-binding SYLF domain-containing protein
MLRRTLRLTTMLGLLALPALTMPVSARADTESAQDQQALVDRATLAVNDVFSSPGAKVARDMLPNARAVMICPRLFRAGFLLGGEGGGCVLLARGGQGSWSSPAFYTMLGGSFGFQAGIQDAEMVMMIRSNNGLRAVLDSQFKLGVDASLTVITLGAAAEGATTAALNADIVAFARTRGLFGGISLQGSSMSFDSGANEVYYGSPIGAIDIVRAMRVNNPGADPLRSALMHYSVTAAKPAPVPTLPPPVPAQGWNAAPSPGDEPAPARAPVQSQSLPPP